MENEILKAQFVLTGECQIIQHRTGVSGCPELTARQTHGGGELFSRPVLDTVAEHLIDILLQFDGTRAHGAMHL